MTGVEGLYGTKGVYDAYTRCFVYPLLSFDCSAFLCVVWFLFFSRYNARYPLDVSMKIGLMYM
jgi:hypothetical protein